VSSKLTDQNRLIALAYLHQGKTPREVEKLMPDMISYPQALRLKKELEQAIEEDTLKDLFSLPDAALEHLMDQTKEFLADAATELTGTVMPLTEALEEITDRVKVSKLLEVELGNAAIALVKRMKQKALQVENVDSILVLSEAISKLQIAFFKTSNINIAQFPADGGPKSGFEAMLKQ
jgi:hypothetical protein